VSIGDELTTGQRLDTNSQWISRELGVLGVPVAFHTTITDSLDDGIAAFRIAAERAEIIVVTGGLGPTADDLTRDVLARVAGVPLELSAAALAEVEARFARRAAPMPESNRRQALFPQGSRIIANPEGTAPGIDLDLPRAAGGGQARVFALPGVPGEMHTMWQATVGPAILAMLPGAGTIRFRRIKCFGAGESAVEAMLPDLVRRGREPLVGITAHEATITLRIAARGRDAAACEAAIAPTEAVIRECLGGIVYGTEDDEVEDATLAALAAADATLATVEIGSLGQVAGLLAAAAARGPAGRYLGGVVLPGVSAGTSVAELAERRRAESGATHALAIGPIVPAVESDGGSAAGVTMVEIVLAGPEAVLRRDHRLGGAGTVRLARASKTAMDLVRTTLVVPPAGDVSPRGATR
jgi:nicotinamide-nucleotide amidase